MSRTDEFMQAVLAGLLLAGSPTSAEPLPLSAREERYLAREQGCRARLEASDSLEYYRPSPPTPTSAPDGKVSELNSPTFKALADIKKRNPTPLTEKDVQELKTAILADGAVDAAERDLMEELVQTRVRGIVVTEVAQPDQKVWLFPVSGASQNLLEEVLSPPLDLSEEWGKGAAGYATMVAYCQKHPKREPRVLEFVRQKLAERWRESNVENAYKPWRDQFSEIYRWATACQENSRFAQALLYVAARQLDQAESDKIPDFLYKFSKPAR